MSGLRFLDQTLFGALVEQAAANPRQRQHHNFHQMEEPCHRMAIGLQPDTYIPPHRHLSADKAEALLVLKGRLGLHELLLVGPQVRHLIQTRARPEEVQQAAMEHSHFRTLRQDGIDKVLAGLTSLEEVRAHCNA